MKKKTTYISLLAALAIIIHGFEYMIPAVTPWFKLGLANSVSLAVLVVFGLKDALALTGLRILISSFLFGTFLTPTFLMSFSGGMISTLSMGAAYRFFTPSLSIVGISLIGAYVHILTQGAVLHCFLIQHSAIFLLLPGMLLLSLVTGVVNGSIAYRLTTHLHSAKQENGFLLDEVH